MSERAQKTNESVSKDALRSAKALPVAALVGKVFSIHADFGVWNQTDNRFEVAESILNHNRNGGQ